MNIKLIVFVFLYIITFSILEYLIFGMKRGSSNYALSTQKLRGKRMSINFLKKTLKSIRNNFLENFISKSTSERTI